MKANRNDSSWPFYWKDCIDYSISSNLRFRIVPVIDDDCVPVEYHVDEYVGCRWQRLRSAVPAEYGFGIAKLKDWVRDYARRAS